jgi:hypothetical protein
MTLYDHNLTPWLQQAGQYIVLERPEEERAEWVLALLDEMEQHLSPEEYAALLRAVAAELGRRLVKLEQGG